MRKNCVLQKWTLTFISGASPGKAGQAGGAGRRLRGGDRIGLPCLIRLIKSECAVAPHCANGKCGGRGGILPCVECGVIWGAETTDFHSVRGSAPTSHFYLEKIEWTSGSSDLHVDSWRATSASTFPSESFSRLLSFHLQNFRGVRTIGVLSGWQAGRRTGRDL